jgi:hypothetical protein
MTIKQYIQKHGLTKRPVKGEGQFIPFVPAALVPEDDNDTFEIYANDDGSHVVSLNTTRKRFRIMHGI